MKPICTAALIGCWLLGPPAHATLVDGTSAPLAIPPYMFQPGEDGTVNPSYTFTGVPGYGTLTVSYGPYFDGQTGSDPLSPPAFVTGAPDNPLALTTGTPVWQTIVEVDNSNPVPDTEVLGGLPTPATNGFGAPIAILFSPGVTGVVLTADDFGTIGSTTIEAFASDATSLGTVPNTGTGYETFNLSDNSGKLIDGLLLTSTEIGGFGIDGVGVNQITAGTAVPTPGVLSVLPGYAVLLLLLRRRLRAAGPNLDDVAERSTVRSDHIRMDRWIPAFTSSPACRWGTRPVSRIQHSARDRTRPIRTRYARSPNRSGRRALVHRGYWAWAVAPYGPKLKAQAAASGSTNQQQKCPTLSAMASSGSIRPKKALNISGGFLVVASPTGFEPVLPP
jgi:hypothetical protein